MCRRLRRSIVASRCTGYGRLRWSWSGHLLVGGGRRPVRARNTSSRSGVCTDRPATSIVGVVEAVEQRRAASRRRRRWGPRGRASPRPPVRGRAMRAAARSALGSANCEPDVTAGHQPLELVGGALGDDPAAVEHADPVGQLVGLVEVLRGQQDRDAVGDQVADDLPHRAPAARVEPGRRLVEEDRSADRPSASSPGRAGAACRRSRSRPAVRAASARSNRSSSSAARRRPSALARWFRSAISRRFSSPVSRSSTAENWPVTPIAARTASGSRRHVVARRPAPRRRRPRSAWRGCGRSSSCRRRWARAGRRPSPAGRSRSIPSRTTWSP